MGQTYKVQDGLTLAQKLAKGVPFTGIDLSICDIVNAAIYKAYPWRDTLKTSASDWTAVTLTDGNQDFSTGLSDLFRMTQFWIIRTDVTPNQYRDIAVAKSLSVDLIPKSPYAVRSASYQAGVNKFRLESAVQVPSGTSWKLGGEYQPHPTKISDLQDSFWFQDEFLQVFAEGVAYWAFKLADDQRAGTQQTDPSGRTTYTGQLSVFVDAIRQMAEAEDFGNIDPYYPAEPIATVDARRYYSTDIFPLI